MNLTRIGLVAATVFFATVSLQAGQPGPSGNWSGNWVSGANGHKGPLNARVERTSPDTVTVHFRGRFAKIVPFRYTSQLQVISESADRTELAGSQKLPFFGNFSTRATIEGDQLNASFQSARDSGEFHLRKTSR